MKKNCKYCNVEFWSDVSIKIYCSKTCYFAAKKALHNQRSIRHYRIKEGVYEKWIIELRSVGYVILPPVNIKTKTMMLPNV